jgi:hypothetical protein
VKTRHVAKQSVRNGVSSAPRICKYFSSLELSAAEGGEGFVPSPFHVDLPDDELPD